MTVKSIIPKYIASVADSYVIAEEALPLEYKGMDRETAENLAAWATALAVNAGRRLGLPRPVLSVFLSRDRDIVTYVEGRESIVALVPPGHGGPLARALAGRGPRCEKCGYDLSLAVVQCPKCGALNPFTATYCRKCGAPLHLRRCPNCGASLDSEGRVVGLASRLLERPARAKTL